MVDPGLLPAYQMCSFRWRWDSWHQKAQARLLNRKFDGGVWSDVGVVRRAIITVGVLITQILCAAATPLARPILVRCLACAFPTLWVRNICVFSGCVQVRGCAGARVYGWEGCGVCNTSTANHEHMLELFQVPLHAESPLVLSD